MTAALKAGKKREDFLIAGAGKAGAAKQTKKSRKMRKAKK
jgi:hypothetical protein